MTDEYKFFKNRKEGKVYLSKVFNYSEYKPERLRNVHIVFDDQDSVLLGEIEGAICLRVTGKARKTQVLATVTQDSREIRRLSLQTFKPRAAGYIETLEKEEFSFRPNEFRRLKEFVESLKFLDFSNEETFQIEDFSTNSGPKAIIDATDRGLLTQLRALTETQRAAILSDLSGSLSSEEINILLGRKKGIFEFESQIRNNDWAEADWQNFFEREQWVFGYGLDYRINKPFDREMTVSGGGTQNQDKAKVDFLRTFTDYTVLVEIKRPDTPIFKTVKGGRAGTWEFSADFIGAVSQAIEQKAEWLAFAQSGDHFSKDGSKKLEAKTRNAKTILVIGSSVEFNVPDNLLASQIKRDTFELFRRENRTIDIVTFDELLDRASFITRNR